MKYRVYYVKSISFEVEAANDIEALDLAEEQLDEYEINCGDCDYEYDDIEELGE